MENTNLNFFENTAPLALKQILEALGLAPIVTRNWRISVTRNHAKYCYDITVSWRSYRIRRSINMDDIKLGQAETLLTVSRDITSQLYIFNEAEDEEHMEAIALIARRPTHANHQ